MDKKELKLFAAEMVVSSKMSKSAKLQMLEFIRHEATDAQLKALLLDGKIVRLDEQAEEIVNDRFDQSTLINEVDPLTLSAGLFGLTILAGIGGTAGVIAKGIYKTYMSKAGRACAGSSGEERQRCIQKYKIKATVEALKKALAKCPQNKNPEKCKAKINKRISALQQAL